MEIKTCEEYVLNKLEETEEKLSNTQEELTAVTSKYNSLYKDINELLELFELPSAGSERFTLSAWKDFDKDQYDFVADFMAKYRSRL